MLQTHIPLSERIRPKTIEDFIGQDHLLGAGKILWHMIHGQDLFSTILWGPPGSGKTTLAHIIARASDSFFVPLSAVTSGIKEVRDVIQTAIQNRKATGKRTILFIDEIHRFNKAQQDAFLPHVERGDIILIGATTENPSFEVVAPLLSRTKVLVLKPLGNTELRKIIDRALSDPENGLASWNVYADEDVIAMILRHAQGDARVALNTLEIAVMMTPTDATGRRILTTATVEEAIQKKVLLYDKDGEEHYNLISALHKSMRDSDPHASLYWLARMIEAGEDPLYIARRLVRFASEDIGNADPRALQIALNAKDAFHFIGLPEGALALAQAVVYLATAPKSNAIYTAYGRAVKAVHETGSLPVPLHIRNAPTRLMQELDYGKGYRYAHDYTDAIVDQEHLPAELAGKKFYFPEDRGYEKTIKERMAYIEAMKKRQAT
ncbi:MAG: replication-associated recombination protein A [Desulfobacterota bacterium]|nr:replication-associated recombination protein A [Thermodesulfobacteriota bacterium]